MCFRNFVFNDSHAVTFKMIVYCIHVAAMRIRSMFLCILGAGAKRLSIASPKKQKHCSTSPYEIPQPNLGHMIGTWVARFGCSRVHV